MLVGFNISLESDATRPAELQTLLNTVLDTPRASPSPAAKRIGAHQKSAQYANEATASRRLVADILFTNEAYGGEKLVTLHEQVPLDLAYQPKAPTEKIRAQYPKGMPQAIPDAIVGYISAHEARCEEVESPFSTKEEAASIPVFAIAMQTLTPFQH